MEIVAKEGWFPSLKEGVQIVITFGLTVIAWVFFRAENVVHARDILVEIFSKSLFSKPMDIQPYIFYLIGIQLLVEWVNRDKDHGLQISETDENPRTMERALRWGAYLVLSFSIAFFLGKENSFIYFQF